MSAANRRTDDRLAGILLVCALLFVVDLFFGWTSRNVRVAGIGLLRTTASGWSGWGVVAGVSALVVAGLAANGLAHRGSSPAATLVAAMTMLVGTTFAIPTSHSSSVVMPMVGVHARTVEWPAWVGLGLASVVAAVALFAAVRSARSTVAPLWRTPPAPPSPR